MAEHHYSAACCGANGWEGVLRAVAGSIDASRFGPEYPCTVPWMVQKVIWRFATAGRLDICNAANVGAGRLPSVGMVPGCIAVLEGDSKPGCGAAAFCDRIV